MTDLIIKANVESGKNLTRAELHHDQRGLILGDVHLRKDKLTPLRDEPVRIGGNSRPLYGRKVKVDSSWLASPLRSQAAI